MLATRGELKSLAVGHFHQVLPDIRLLRGWRRELVGQDLVDLLDGKKSLRVEEGKRILASAGG